MLDMEERVSASVSARDITAARDTLEASGCELRAAIAQFVSEISMKTPEAAAIVSRAVAAKSRVAADAFDIIEAERRLGGSSK